MNHGVARRATMVTGQMITRASHFRLRFEIANMVIQLVIASVANQDMFQPMIRNPLWYLLNLHLVVTSTNSVRESLSAVVVLKGKYQVPTLL